MRTSTGGTYQQRIEEVRVEVLLDGHPAGVNDGVSFVRFADPGNTVELDHVTTFAEPHADLARLCYKRLQRRGHVDTMAFSTCCGSRTSACISSTKRASKRR